MLSIPIATIPNQIFNVLLDQNEWEISIYLANNIMAVDLNLNGVDIIIGQRAVPATPLIPYEYLENGNFIFVTDDYDYPIYTEFGISQLLVYASPTELLEIRNGNGT
jgi:hypothetical protein